MSAVSKNEQGAPNPIVLNFIIIVLPLFIFQRAVHCWRYINSIHIDIIVCGKMFGQCLTVVSSLYKALEHWTVTALHVEIVLFILVLTKAVWLERDIAAVISQSPQQISDYYRVGRFSRSQLHSRWPFLGDIRGWGIQDCVYMAGNVQSWPSENQPVLLVNYRTSCHISQSNCLGYSTWIGRGTFNRFKLFKSWIFSCLHIFSAGFMQWSLCDFEKRCDQVKLNTHFFHYLLCFQSSHSGILETLQPIKKHR